MCNGLMRERTELFLTNQMHRIPLVHTGSSKQKEMPPCKQATRAMPFHFTLKQSMKMGRTTFITQIDPLLISNKATLTTPSTTPFRVLVWTQSLPRATRERELLFMAWSVIMMPLRPMKKAWGSFRKIRGWRVASLKCRRRRMGQR